MNCLHNICILTSQCLLLGLAHISNIVLMEKFISVQCFSLYFSIFALTACLVTIQLLCSPVFTTKKIKIVYLFTKYRLPNPDTFSDEIFRNMDSRSEATQQTVSPYFPAILSCKQSSNASFWVAMAHTGVCTHSECKQLNPDSYVSDHHLALPPLLNKTHRYRYV